MRLRNLGVFLFGLVACATAALGQARLQSCEPRNGKAGDTIAVTGENLTKDNVTKLYLTDGKDDLEVAISEQTATSIKFAIPAKAKPGRFSLMILTGGKDQKLVEQPVKVTVEGAS
ncbi:MAG: hypothetical protein FJW40_25225 [Acidobacteria bacterium]|nr:hypothetical protein [Acidobacteriota bacterium]